MINFRMAGIRWISILILLLKQEEVDVDAVKEHAGIGFIDRFNVALLHEFHKHSTFLYD